jgi:hypothetical protein
MISFDYRKVFPEIWQGIVESQIVV